MKENEEAKHSPGPWKAIVPPSSCLTSRFVESEDGAHICKVGHLDYSTGDLFTDLANARLIAAAPELLAALKAALPFLPLAAPGAKDVLHPALGQARAAIAKATENKQEHFGL